MEFLVIAFSLHRKSLFQHASHSIIAHLWGASIGSTDSLIEIVLEEKNIPYSQITKKKISIYGVLYGENRIL